MTAQEFITALQSGGTVEVDSDIDFNDYYFSSYVEIPDRTIINGNGHTLTNIQQGSSLVIFYGRGIFTWNNINIRNVNLPNTQLFYTSSTSHSYANECQISGYIYQIHFGANNTNMTFNRCSLNINRYIEINATLRDCYVVLENNLYKGGNARYYYFGVGINTYYKGKLSNANGSLLSNGTLDNCCFNIDIEGNSANSVEIHGSNLVSVVNSDKIEGILNSSSPIVAVTDTEMHNAQILFDKGFNIYVP